MTNRGTISRRRFNRMAAAAMGLGPVMCRGGQNAGSPASGVVLPDDERLGIALVGLGSYSTRQLAPALEETGRCRLAGIVTGTPSKAVSWQERYPQLEGHVYDYESFDRIADDSTIDIVYVVLPNSMHAEYTIRAAEAGKHVICEKPMAVSAAEAQRMIDACDKAGRKLYIGYRLHFEPHNLEAMRIGREQVFGRVKYMQTAFGFRIGDPRQWRLRKSLAGGGALMDVGIYALQAARYVTGEEPVRVTAQEYKTDPEKFAEVDETITWQMTFPSGCAANCATTYAASHCPENSSESASPAPPS
ncbi:MAG: Gfo/Idh/MocA family oxidoreductase, partial [Rhodothermales bacterium]|nr:Gfo/Idh/MocA family oxidoreductase [Rhodothermales bacterium]